VAYTYYRETLFLLRDKDVFIAITPTIHTLTTPMKIIHFYWIREAIASKEGDELNRRGE
jgi:hypothetical protein